MSDGERNEHEKYGELLAGFVGGLAVAAVLDGLAHQRSGVGQWLVRTLAGEGESLLEGLYALRQRLRLARTSMAEAYGWGKFAGLIFPWLVDALSRLAGVDIYRVESFCVPHLYAMSDQIAANAAGFIYIRGGSLQYTRGGARVWTASCNADQLRYRPGRPTRAVARTPWGIQPKHTGSHGCRNHRGKPLLVAAARWLVDGEEALSGAPPLSGLLSRAIAAARSRVSEV